MGLARPKHPERVRLGLSPGKLPGGVTVQGEPLVIDAPADVLVAEVSQTVLKHAHDSIKSGRDAKTGGSKPAVTPRVARQQGRRSQFRGYNTGELAEDLERSPVQGSTAKARATIQHPDPGRAVFLADEMTKGTHHTSTEGVARDKIETTVQAFAERALGGEHAKVKTSGEQRSQEASKQRGS